jgi:hypothetical protein
MNESVSKLCRFCASKRMNENALPVLFQSFGRIDAMARRRSLSNAKTQT